MFVIVKLQYHTLQHIFSVIDFAVEIEGKKNL